jgi:hypothetical protein
MHHVATNNNLRVAACRLVMSPEVGDSDIEFYFDKQSMVTLLCLIIVAEAS